MDRKARGHAGELQSDGGRVSRWPLTQTRPLAADCITSDPDLLLEPDIHFDVALQMNKTVLHGSMDCRVRGISKGIEVRVNLHARTALNTPDATGA